MQMMLERPIGDIATADLATLAVSSELLASGGYSNEC